MTPTLEELRPCFQGQYPSVVATCSADGMPNVGYMSHVHYVDAGHVALSCQFFNKTLQNLRGNPQALVEVLSPAMELFLLRLTHVRSEESGALFDTMAARLAAIAAVSGASEMFKLRSVEVFQVRSIEARPRVGPPVTPAPRSAELSLQRLRDLHTLTTSLNKGDDLDVLLATFLAGLERLFGVAYSAVWLSDERQERLYTLATRGYPLGSAGAEVARGEGLVGTVAATGRALRIADLPRERSYAQSSREAPPSPDVLWPRLPEARSHLSLPMRAGDELMGVLTVESPRIAAFDEHDEATLEVAAAHLTSRLRELLDPALDATGPLPARPPSPRVASAPPRTFRFYRQDGSIFVDGAYLTRGVPALLLWRLLRQHERDGRVDFTNRELRLDPALKLPPLKDNLESRISLLRQRLALKCPEVKLLPVARGAFRLELGRPLALVEQDAP